MGEGGKSYCVYQLDQLKLLLHSAPKYFLGSSAYRALVTIAKKI